METIYEYYHQYYDECKKNAKEMEDFFDIMKHFMNKSYEEKLTMMNNIWGSQMLFPIMYPYGTHSNILINKDEDGTIKFHFTYHLSDVYKLSKFNPELIESLKKQNILKPNFI